jgi:hypothetical protein
VYACLNKRIIDEWNKKNVNLILYEKELPHLDVTHASNITTILGHVKEIVLHIFWVMCASILGVCLLEF